MALLLVCWNLLGGSVVLIRMSPISDSDGLKLLESKPDSLRVK